MDNPFGYLPTKIPNSGIVFPFSHRETLLEDTPNFSHSAIISFPFNE